MMKYIAFFQFYFFVVPRKMIKEVWLLIEFFACLFYLPFSYIAVHFSLKELKRYIIVMRRRSFFHEVCAIEMNKLLLLLVEIVFWFVILFQNIEICNYYPPKKMFRYFCEKNVLYMAWTILDTWKETVPEKVWKQNNRLTFNPGWALIGIWTTQPRGSEFNSLIGIKYSSLIIKKWHSKSYIG